MWNAIDRTTVEWLKAMGYSQLQAMIVELGMSSRALLSHYKPSRIPSFFILPACGEDDGEVDVPMSARTCSSNLEDGFAHGEGLTRSLHHLSAPIIFLTTVSTRRQ